MLHHATDPALAELIDRETIRQREGLELIASENFASPAVQAAAGSVLTNKYAEGYPGKRYYGGCEVIDEVEQLAIDRAKQLFGAAWANVQPHSGSQANAAVYLALLRPGDTFLGFDLAHGGHLSHGSPVNYSGQCYRAVHYGVSPDSGRVDMEQVEQLARKYRPRLIICGASAYSRDWDYMAFRTIADSVGALLMADIAHPAGFIATRLLNDPLPHCHVVTTTTHKTLRGPRGGMLLMGQDQEDPVREGARQYKSLARRLDAAVFPGTQGGPLMHIIAAKAVAFGEALQPQYMQYTKRVKHNAQALARDLMKAGYTILTNGTDNHSFLVDLTSWGVTGREAEIALEEAGIAVNKNMLPFDKRSPFITSGIRLGTAAITTRGLYEEDMARVAIYLDQALRHRENSFKLKDIKQQIAAWMRDYCLHAVA